MSDKLIDVAHALRGIIAQATMLSPDVVKPRVVIEVESLDAAYQLMRQIKADMRLEDMSLFTASEVAEGRIVVAGVEFQITSREANFREMAQRRLELQRWFERVGRHIRV